MLRASSVRGSRMRDSERAHDRYRQPAYSRRPTRYLMKRGFDGSSSTIWRKPQHLHVDTAIERVVIAATRTREQIVPAHRAGSATRRAQPAAASARNESRAARPRATTLLADVERDSRRNARVCEVTVEVARGHLLAAQQRMDPRHQFARQERLREVIVGAGFKADHVVERVALRGQHQDRQRLSFGAQLRQMSRPSSSANHQIEHSRSIRLALR